MDQALATLFGGVMAGVAGLISALLSFLSLRQQINVNAAERKRDRDHQLRLQIEPHSIRSLERLWAYLQRMQLGERLSDDQVDEYLASTLWLPSKYRERALTTLNKYLEGTATAVRDISYLQDQIAGYAKHIRAEESEE